MLWRPKKINNPVSVRINSARLYTLQNVQWSVNRIKPGIKEWCFQMHFPERAFLSLTWRLLHCLVTWACSWITHLQGLWKSRTVQGRGKGPSPLGLGREETHLLPLVKNGIFPASDPASEVNPLDGGALLPLFVQHSHMHPWFKTL